MLWKIVSIIAIMIGFLGGLLMLTPNTFFGEIIMALGIVLLCICMATPEEW